MEYLVNSPKMLGQHLMQIRKQKDLTQSEAGNILGLEQSTVSSIENGAPGTRLATLFRLLAVLELEVVIRPKQKQQDFEQDW